MWLAAVGPGATILVLAPGLSTRCAQVITEIAPSTLDCYAPSFYGTSPSVLSPSNEQVATPPLTHTHNTPPRCCIIGTVRPTKY